MKFTNPRNARVEVGDGDNDKTLAITYTAAIALPDPVTLEITVAGITLRCCNAAGRRTQCVDGYVTGSGSSTNRTLAVSGNTITWTWTTSPFTRAGATFTTTIQNVDIQDTSGEVTWTTTIAGAMT